MILSPVTKIVIALGVLGIPYFIFFSPDGSSVASVSERAERPQVSVAPPVSSLVIDGTKLGTQNGGDRVASLDSYANFVERPLFNSSRRAPEIVEEVVVEPEPEPEPEPELTNWFDDEFVRLVGTIRQGDEIKALIASSEYEELFVVGIGEEVSRWTVKNLAIDRAVLEHEGEPLILQLLE